MEGAGGAFSSLVCSSVRKTTEIIDNKSCRYPAVPQENEPNSSGLTFLLCRCPLLGHVVY